MLANRYIGLFAACGLGLVHPCKAIDITTVSSRPDSVSGGDVLVQISALKDANWSARLNAQDVSRAFRPAGESGNLLALLTGLKVGANKLEIRIHGAMRSRLQIVNHPAVGPIFSGPHQEPFICQTVANGVGPALDADCSARTMVEYYYKSNNAVQADSDPLAQPATRLAPGFKTYDVNASPPADVAEILTSDGRTVPYIVRREIGTLNRAVYDIQFLHQPGAPLPNPWTHPTPGWNGRLVYLLDGGCAAGYRQGTFNGAVGAANVPFLAQGYATATSTLNIAANNCNDRIAAETLSMVKEHFIKEFGAPVHTIGWGESGGAIEQYLIAQNYPGLLDGLIPDMSFPDVVTTAQSVTDCALLERAFTASRQRWTEEEKAAVSGFASWRTCSQGLSNFLLADATRFCDPLIPKELIFDRVARPKGLRCDLYDNAIDVFGRDPRTGLARRPLDNVGVQYGLRAFNLGKIDAEQFLSLNESIGGYDDDGHLVSARTRADPETVRIAYQRGLILTGGGGLVDIPIIDWRPYADDMANQHDRFRSFVTRARLIAATGTADNQVILTYPRWSAVDLARYTLTHRWEAVFPDHARDLVRQMDRWLEKIAADRGAGTPSQKVARNRPAELSDSCWTVDGARVTELATVDGPGRCNQLYPSHADPRIAAGAPLTDDVLKCTLKPLDASDYAERLTAPQMERLKALFPTGVCDYARPGVGQTNLAATWQQF